MKILLALFAAIAATTVLAQGQPPLPTVQLTAGVHVIQAEVADNFSSRMQGLMLRPSMPQNGGMLFIFEERAVHCMWMKNTLIPLSVAFLDDAGAIVSISDMRPHDETSHCAAKPARYALEMDWGWFAQRGLKPGAKLHGLERFFRK